jgi:hypothetical protein
MLRRDKALEMYSEGRDLLSAKLIERAQLFRALDKLVKYPQPIGPLIIEIDWHQAILLSDVLIEIEREIYWLVDAINTNAQQCGKPRVDRTNTNLD